VEPGCEVTDAGDDDRRRWNTPRGTGRGRPATGVRDEREERKLSAADSVQTKL